MEYIIDGIRGETVLINLGKLDKAFSYYFRISVSIVVGAALPVDKTMDFLGW